jgi:hypothetical protein
MYNLIDLARKHVAAQTELATARIFIETRHMTQTQREQLPDLEFNKPVDGDEAKARK